MKCLLCSASIPLESASDHLIPCIVKNQPTKLQNAVGSFKFQNLLVFNETDLTKALENPGTSQILLQTPLSRKAILHLVAKTDVRTYGKHKETTRKPFTGYCCLRSCAGFHICTNQKCGYLLSYLKFNEVENRGCGRTIDQILHFFHRILPEFGKIAWQQHLCLSSLTNPAL